jgi:NitT/TauT family transport system permease protein
LTLTKYLRLFFPSFAVLITLLAQIFIPKSSLDFKKQLPYYEWILFASLAITLICAIVYLITKKNEKYLFKGWFTGAVFIIVGIYNLATLKFQLINPLFFPAPDKILGVFFKDGTFLLKCVGASLRMLSVGLFFGIVLGLLTGVLIGWFTKWNYWLDPIVKILGPIPSTAFIPIALTSFHTPFQASVFLLALTVWFPVTILTYSGISNIKKTFFEVADTFGASDFQKIVHVAIPGALPNIFVGIFNGMCSSFITLMTAEMLGVKFGIGWYINWQREIMGYANVYAGLIVIAVTFTIMITILFKIRDHFLKWQKGFVKW